MRKIILSLMICFPLFAMAQEGAWTLDRCIQYALDHNLSVKQGDLNVQQQQVNLSTARNAVWPAVSASATQSLSFGRGISEDNTYVSSNTANTSFGLGASVDLFTGLRTKSRIDIGKLNLPVNAQGRKWFRYVRISGMESDTPNEAGDYFTSPEVDAVADVAPVSGYRNWVLDNFTWDKAWQTNLTAATVIAPNGLPNGLNCVYGLAPTDTVAANVPFKVVSFDALFPDQMGNMIQEVSSGSQFSERQKNQIRRLQRGKQFFITHVKATGPDGITREIAPMQVIVN